MILSVHCDTAHRLAEAQALAQQLNLPFGVHTSVELWVLPDKLALKQQGCSPFWVDFDCASVKTDLTRACKASPGRVILDVTAGLGRDASILMACGAQVSLLERDPILFALLQDGLKRAHLEQVPCYLMDAETYLSELPATSYPDVIYIDPMHPLRRKSAKVKKDMQCLQQWIAPTSPLRLLQLALKRTRDRVVIKWPVREAPLLKPNHAYTGKTVRYDVFIRSKIV